MCGTLPSYIVFIYKFLKNYNSEKRKLEEYFANSLYYLVDHMTDFSTCI